MATEQPTEVGIKIPCRAEYVGVARLAILGVASRMRFSYDEVEDIRLAVGEACASAIERSKKRCEQGDMIDIRCIVDENKLTVEVADRGNVKPNAEAPEAPESSGEDQGLGALLMGLLVDEVETETTQEGGNRIRMTKYVER